MDDGIFLRDYRACDLDAMFQLDEVCFSEEFRFDLEAMREFAEEPDAVVHVAEDSSGEIVGFVIVHVEQIAMEFTAYVVTLDVSSGYRRKGLACRLMNEAESRVRAAGVRWIQLHVFTGNQAAISLYERLGYKRMKIHRGFYGRAGLDAIVYGKQLLPDL